MSSASIFLILICGLGVLHGLSLAVFLWFYPVSNRRSNKILSLLLLMLSLRVGKSVFLLFAEDLAIQFVFVGLAILMAIGPLFYLYTRSVVEEGFRVLAGHLLHFIPAFAGLLLGVWMNKDLVNRVPKMGFVLMFGLYYGHFLLYLLLSYKIIARAGSEERSDNSQSFLRLLFYALLAIWVVYVLNLFDDIIPYIIGPMLYTLVAYAVTFVVIKKGYLKDSRQPKYKTTPVSEEQTDQLYAKVLKLIIAEKQFKNGDLTLKSLSEQLKVTPQTLSLVINKKSETNFNSFINHHRIAESIQLFQSEAYAHHTIAAIAFEVGFNSISSFNAAFKKETGSTPTTFRKKLITTEKD